MPKPRVELCPASPRGWFDGTWLTAEDAIESVSGCTLSEAADILEASFAGRGHALTAVVAGYDGTCSVVCFGSFSRHPSPEPGSAAASEFGPAASPEPVPAATPSDCGPLLKRRAWDLSAREYRSAVERTREHIAAGDVYVLNLTARLSGDVTLSPTDAFDVLRERAGADMAALLTSLPGDTPWLACVSPERFLRVQEDSWGERTAEISPIKGTRQRGETQEADEAAATALLGDQKERAEHLMVVDLERNDLGAVCIPGSVRVEPLYEVVTTPYCHQLVSTVLGTLRPETTFAELLESTFPCGSVTGAPKRAAMRIARELEASPRGAYCGALLVAIPGQLDSAVLIRTLEGVAESPHRARWGTGAGITFDSISAAEQLEVLLKTAPVTGESLPDVALRETMRVAFGDVPLLDLHLARLARGGAGPRVLARVREAVGCELALADVSAPYLRLGVTVTPDGEVCVGMSDDPSSLAVEGGPRIVPVEVAEPPALPSGAAKPASRRYWDKAHNVARMRGGDQAILHLPDGALVDGSTATLWLVRDGELLTPVAPPAVAGVAREAVLDAAMRLGIAAREVRLTLADLDAADEVFLSNGVGLVVPARGRGGATTTRIAEEVLALFGDPAS